MLDTDTISLSLNWDPPPVFTENSFQMFVYSVSLQNIFASIHRRIFHLLNGGKIAAICFQSPLLMMMHQGSLFSKSVFYVRNGGTFERRRRVVLLPQEMVAVRPKARISTFKRSPGLRAFFLFSCHTLHKTYRDQVFQGRRGKKDSFSRSDFCRPIFIFFGKCRGKFLSPILEAAGADWLVFVSLTTLGLTIWFFLVISLVYFSIFFQPYSTVTWPKCASFT